MKWPFQRRAPIACHRLPPGHLSVRQSRRRRRSRGQRSLSHPGSARRPRHLRTGGHHPRLHQLTASRTLTGRQQLQPIALAGPTRRRPPPCHHKMTAQSPRPISHNVGNHPRPESGTYPDVDHRHFLSAQTDKSVRASRSLPTPRCSCRSAAWRALFTVFAVRSAVGRPPRERAKLRANAGRRQATPSDARRLSSLVKCPLSDTEPRPATPGT